MFSLLYLAFHAGAVTSLGVPTSCQASLRAFYAGRHAERHVVDWTGWGETLARLGYEASYAARLMAENPWPPEQIRDQVRDTLTRPEWTWAEGVDRAQSRRLGRWPQNQLPFEYLSSVPGFDPVAAIGGRLDQEEPIKFDELRWLARRASFWLRGPQRSEVALGVIAKVNGQRLRLHAHRWLDLLLTEPERRRLRTDVVTRQLDFDDADLDTWFAALDHLPLEALPPKVRRGLKRMYLGPAATPPLRCPGVARAAFGLVPAGGCEEMSFRHLRLLFPASDPARGGVSSKPRPFVIRVNGRVVGLLKNEEEPSVMALTDVVDQSGRSVLIKGGVYQTTRHAWPKPTRTITRRGWPLLDVDELRVAPIGPVLGVRGWKARNAMLLASLMGGRIESNYALILREIVRSDEYEQGNIGHLRGRYHRRVWTEILRRIDGLKASLDRAAAG